MQIKRQDPIFVNRFEKLNDNEYSFTSCETCNAQCCDGSKNTLHSPIILDDFNEVSKHFPILFIYGNLGYIRPVILLTNGKDFCKYIKDMRCSIYKQRPSVCRVYPLSPHVSDEIYIDNSCPSVIKKVGQTTKEDKVYKDFDNEILYTYSDKYINTHYYFEPFNKKENLELAIKINDIEFYKFKEDFGQEYIKTHLSSLEHLETPYFKP